MTSKLILGTVQLGTLYGINNQTGIPSFHEIQKMLDYAFANNIAFLDTAEAYGNAHVVIGKYHQNSPNRFHVITKFSSSATQNLSAASYVNFYQRVKKHLQTLHVDSLYAYMFHSYADFKSFYSLHAKELTELKEEKLIQKIGVSIYTNEEAEKLLQQEDVTLIQLPFNLLDNKNQREEILQKLRAAKKEIHTRSTFLQGLFFKDTNNLPPSLLPLKNNLDTIKKIAGQHQISLEQLALQYVLRQTNIDRVLIGTETKDQLQKNIENSQLKMNIEIFKEIDELKIKNEKLLNPSRWK